MRTVFISYATVDKPQIRQIEELLRLSGNVTPWFDGYLIAGREWQAQLDERIQECDVFLYALTPESVKSEWCLWEYAKAVEYGKHIVPVLMQARTELPKSLSKVQYVDASDGLSAVVGAKLMAAIMGQPPQIAKASVELPKVLKGTPPQAIADVIEPVYPVESNDSQVEDEPDCKEDEEFIEDLTDELVRALVRIEEDGEAIHYGRFVVWVDRDDHWSTYEYFGEVSPHPYGEYKHKSTVKDNRRKLSSEYGWDRATMRKTWAISKNSSALQRIAEELIETQHEVFGVCEADIRIWPRD